MTKQLWKTAGLAVALMGLGAGCGGDKEGAGEGAAAEPAKPVYACNAPSENDSNCVEWTGGGFPDEESAQQECAANRGTYSGHACPSEGVVARCTRHKGTAMETREVWYGPKMTADAVESACQGPDTEFQAG